MDLTTNQQILLATIYACQPDGDTPASVSEVNKKVVSEGGSKSSSTYQALIKKGLIAKGKGTAHLTVAGLELMDSQPETESADEQEAPTTDELVADDLESDEQEVDSPEAAPEKSEKKKSKKRKKRKLLDGVPVFDARGQELDSQLVVIRLVGRSKKQADEVGIDSATRRRIAEDVFNAREAEEMPETFTEPACRFKTLHDAVLARIADEGGEVAKKGRKALKKALKAFCQDDEYIGSPDQDSGFEAGFRAAALLYGNVDLS